MDSEIQHANVAIAGTRVRKTKNKTMKKRKLLEERKTFSAALTNFVKGLAGYVSAEDGQWTVKGFIDI